MVPTDDPFPAAYWKIKWFDWKLKEKQLSEPTLREIFDSTFYYFYRPSKTGTIQDCSKNYNKKEKNIM